jgi:hypothetical protein
VTLDQVTPESLLLHRPFPLGAPRYRMLLRLGSTGSVARLTTPFQPQLVKPTQSSSGTHRPVLWFQR